MDERYRAWLRSAVPSEATFRTKLSELRRIEKAYGDLDAQFDADELTSLIEDLTYSSADARSDQENPSLLIIDGDLRNNLASYKSAASKYARFRQDLEGSTTDWRKENTEQGLTTDLSFRYEQDLQTALIACLDQLEPGMTLVEGGKEYQVASGRIDARAIDKHGNSVVLELKAVTAKRDVLGQIAAYMADISDETGKRPRGILIAPEFDDKLISGARMIENLELKKYAFSFSFSNI